MQTASGLKYRVRYGYQQKEVKGTLRYYPHPKNVLVTIPSGKDYVFFGIARCKLSADNFRKKEGRELALNRALQFFNNDTTGLAAFYLSGDGTRGYCHVRYVRTLLRHFEGLDQKGK